MTNSFIVIDTPGSYISKSGNRFVIKNKGDKQEYSADKLTQVLFLAPSAISSEAVKLAIEKNIDLVYMDYRGNPYARTYRTTLGGTTLTRKKQLEATVTEKSVKLVKSIVLAKIKSQQTYLKSLAKDRKDNEDIKKLSQSDVFSPDKKQFSGTTLDIVRPVLFGVEGAAAATYFKALGLITGYSKRDPKVKDSFNICLNYAYGILYGETERACILAGLDPYLGYYHTDRYGKPCMVLDVIELFRVAVADRAVVTLFNRKEINDKDFDKRGSLTLSTEGKRKIIQAVIKRLNTKILYKQKKLTLKDIMLSQTREMASYLNGHSREFKPFIYK